MNGWEIEYPWALALLLMIPGILHVKKRRRVYSGYSAGSFIDRHLAPNGWKRYGPDVLAALFITLTILAISNIRYAKEWEGTQMESRWIMMVQDLSGSMNRSAAIETDQTLGDVALDGIRFFIGLREKTDLVGLVAFSSYARLVAPPTFDRNVLHRKLDLMSRHSDSAVFRDLSAGGATNASYAAWIALCGFFMMLPEEHQLSYSELDDFRHQLLGETLEEIKKPEKLRKARFGHGMAIVLFTDGRIDAHTSADDVRKGLPNFINVIRFMRKLDVRLYLIVLSREIAPEVKSALEGIDGGERAGKIFFMPDGLNPEKIRRVYETVNGMEKNRLLVRLFIKKKDTRGVFTAAAFGCLIVYAWMFVSPRSRRI